VYEFLAIGPGVKQRWRRNIRPDEVVRLGRDPAKGWAVPWDMRISREHADLILQGDRLRVRRLATARNSIYVRGEPSEDFTVGPREDFRIGKTTFRLAAASAESKQSTGSDSHPDLDDSLTSIAGQPEPLRLQAVLARLGDAQTQPQEAATRAPPPVAASVRLPSPTVDGVALGEYELVDQLHRGKAGQVLKARHRYLQRRAAIQILSSVNATDESIARFRRKARILAEFRHENIIAAYEAGVLDGVHFLVTEYVDGWSLAQLARRQTLDTATVIDYVIQAARGLEHAHSRNVVHRDIRPAHLLAARGGVIKLIGWGKAWCAGDWSLSDDEGAGRLLGTRQFMAPEQLADSSDVDGRSDIYSLGQTLFALLATRPDDATESELDDSAADAARATRPLSSLRADIPDDLDGVYRKMTDREIALRFQSMSEAAEALRACGSGV